MNDRHPSKLQQIESELVKLQKIAENEKEGMLSYLIEMAMQEARELSERSSKFEQEHTANASKAVN